MGTAWAAGWPCSHCSPSTGSPSVATMHLLHVLSRKPNPMPMMLFCEGHIFCFYFWLGSGGIVQGGVEWGSLRHSVSGPMQWDYWKGHGNWLGGVDLGVYMVDGVDGVFYALWHNYASLVSLCYHCSLQRLMLTSCVVIYCMYVAVCWRWIRRGVAGHQVCYLYNTGFAVAEQDRCVSWKGVWVGQVCEWDSCLHEWDRCVTHWDRYLGRTGVWVRQVNTVYGHLSKTRAVVGSSFTDYLYNCNSKEIKNLFGATMLHAGWALFGTWSILINLFCTWTLSVGRALAIYFMYWGCAAFKGICFFTARFVWEGCCFQLAQQSGKGGTFFTVSVWERPVVFRPSIYYSLAAN